jgi:hypothetical protein
MSITSLCESQHRARGLLDHSSYQSGGQRTPRKPRHSVPSRFRYRVAAIVANRTNPSALWDVTSILHPGLAAEAGAHHCRYHKAKDGGKAGRWIRGPGCPSIRKLRCSRLIFATVAIHRGKIFRAAIDDSGPSPDLVSASQRHRDSEQVKRSITSH